MDLQLKVRELEVRGPGWRHCGVWTPGERYQVGDLVTWNGSSHLWRESTNAEPVKAEDASRAWVMIAQRGKPGGRCRYGPAEEPRR